MLRISVASCLRQALSIEPFRGEEICTFIIACSFALPARDEVAREGAWSERLPGAHQAYGQRAPRHHFRHVPAISALMCFIIAYALAQGCWVKKLPGPSPTLVLCLAPARGVQKGEMCAYPVCALRCWNSRMQWPILISSFDTGAAYRSVFVLLDQHRDAHGM